MKVSKKKILNTLNDAWINLFYYERKEDDVLPVGAIESAIKTGVITVDEMVKSFRDQIEANIKGG